MNGVIIRVSGPVVTASGLEASMYDVVRVGKEKLMGEVIQIDHDHIVIQVYEDTSGLMPGEPVENTGKPLTVKLGPGMLTSIYDGIQRPLPELQKMMGDFIKRGAYADGIDKKKKWEFNPTVKDKSFAAQGDVLGEVEESPGLMHKIMVPPGISGIVSGLKKGNFKVDEVICKIDDKEITMMQEWPVRKARPVQKKLLPQIPLVTGQRVLDALFPLAKGGVAAIPGPFGAGKTVSQQSLAKWSDADIIVYIGCGERGNEMTEVLVEFPDIIDPRTGKPLMNRTILIANTSNMPVAAREASIYTGITMAEYYRDMGYSVALMADSTSRWAEAMREISSRLEEMPGEEGYPAYLSSRVADFYERSGRVIPLGNTIVNKNGEKEGSVSIIGAVSPPGGDFSEPVTQNTLRVVKAFWALDAKLAQRRHFPSINWLVSYSLYLDTLDIWFSKNVAADWRKHVNKIMAILQEESKLMEIVQLVGSDALPERQQLTLEVARVIRESFLQQNAFHEVDAFSPLKKTYAMMKTILYYNTLANNALDMGVKVKEVLKAKAKTRISEVKFEADYEKRLKEIENEMEKEFETVVKTINA